MSSSVSLGLNRDSSEMWSVRAVRSSSAEPKSSWDGRSGKCVGWEKIEGGRYLSRRLDCRQVIRL